MSFKISEAEARVVRANARRNRTSVSEYIRRRALAEPSAPPKPTVVVCPHTGASVFRGASSGAPLTVAATRELLADFP